MTTFSSLLRHTLPLLAAAALAGLSTAQQVLLPDNMYLGTTTTTTAGWRTTLGRFQLAYDSSHFTNAGVTGPIVITRLRFRAEDGQRDLGGHVYTGVTVEVGNCAVDHAAMSATFTTNRGAMGTAGTANVTVLPASGGVPNDYVIDIDLTAIGAMFVYDPSTGTDLLVDVSFPAPAPATNLVPFSTASPTVATARGRMCSTGTASATTGSLGAPLTVLVGFAGTGGHAAITPARSERFGVGCGEGLASFYQDFQLAETCDLANKGFRMTPNSTVAPTGYLVTAVTTPPDLTKVNVTPNTIGDEQLVTHPLGFTLAYPTGTTTTIKACTNGFIWLDAAMTATDLSPSASELMGISVAQTARLCAFWYDLHCGRNTATHPNSGLHVLTDTSGGAGNAVCYVTWFNVGVFNTNAVGGTSVNDLQIVIYEATGAMEVRYGSMQASSITLGIAGWSPGRVGTVASLHPGPRDLSHEMPFMTQPDGSVHALTHNVTQRPIQGVPFAMQGFNQPSGTVFGATLIGFVPVQPGLAFAPLAPGCVASLMPGSFQTYEMYAAPTGTVTSTPLTVPPGYMGAVFYTQYVALTASGLVYSSNGVKLTVGLN